MKRALQPSRQSNWMLLLEGVLYNIVNYKARKLRNSCLTSNHALYHKKVGQLLGSSIMKLMSMSPVAFARSSLNHDDVFILDTKSKIFQFNGAKSCIQERAKALEVVQFIKDSHHDGQCEVAGVEDGRLMADADAGEFWALFGGFAPLQRKVAVDQDIQTEETPPKLLCIDKGQAVTIEVDSLTRDLLDSNKCYLLDFGLEVFIWTGRNTPLDERKSANVAAEEFIHSVDRPQAHLTRVIEGFETVMFRSKFDSWPQTHDAAVSEDGKGKVAALLKRQGLDVKGLVKAAPANDEPQPYIDCTGDLQVLLKSSSLVWRVNGQEKSLLESSEQSKLYTGDCYIFHYSYPGDNNGEYLIGSWFGRQGVEILRVAQPGKLALNKFGKLI
ncbi:Villin-3 [Asimina triloba]